MTAADISLDRMVSAVENVRRRLLKATRALEGASIDYAVVGGNAVAAWVSTVDPGAIRNTHDVDLLLRRPDLVKAIPALESAGFVHWNGPGFDVFRDGPDGRPSEGVHILYSGERVFGDDAESLPQVENYEQAPLFRVVSLVGLVRMKLIANRDKDRTHVRDLIGVGLVDQSWIEKYPPILAARLKHVLDTPNG